MSALKHFVFPDHAPNSGTVKAKCKYCPTYISGNAKTTSNFVTHLKRKHRDIFIQSKSEDGTQISQTNISNFTKSTSVSKYSANDASQMQITDALVSFVAGNLTPLSVVESPEFKTFVESLNPKYQLPSRKHLSTKLLHQKASNIQSNIKEKLRSAESVCLTIDLWSNRQMKGFLGITGHFILDWCMKSIMVSCKRFKGKHCAENIRQEYEEAVACYNIADKITNIITDNASNMTKAFDFSLPGYTCNNEEKNSKSDSEDENDESELEPINIDFPEDDLPKHGRCYAHTLQLVVRDGLKDASPHLKTVISKASNIVRYVRKSINASDILEGEKRLQAENATRWNSQITMIRSVLEVSEEKLNKLDTIKLTGYERKLLQELCLVLKPFEDATIMVQKEINVSGSLAVPVTLGLEHKLAELSTTYNNKMVSTLMSSMTKRLLCFKSEDVYLISAILDPRFKLRWSKDPVAMEEKLLTYARKQKVDCENYSDESSPPRKMSKSDDTGLFSFMTPTKGRKKHISGDIVKMEISQYLLEPCDDACDPLKYWNDHTEIYPILTKLAKTYLTIPATSAPVERLFSVAGKFFRPDRCRLSDSTFQMLMMIKCNEKFAIA
ncbi:zinc finger BED domain-containing protein 4-like [Mytilus trossulus]|uniref:zinc finger BED domain-containing protein 4-like n=1 Tax=Mytilus trossulus TaxID=6551 RepID=UPI003003BB54